MPDNQILYNETVYKDHPDGPYEEFQLVVICTRVSIPVYPATDHYIYLYRTYQELVPVEEGDKGKNKLSVHLYKSLFAEHSKHIRRAIALIDEWKGSNNGEIT